MPEKRCRQKEQSKERSKEDGDEVGVQFTLRSATTSSTRAGARYLYRRGQNRAVAEWQLSMAPVMGVQIAQ